MGSATTSYAEINKAVAALIAHHAENDPDRAAYMVARAAVLHIRATAGRNRAASVALELGVEVLGSPG